MNRSIALLTSTIVITAAATGCSSANESRTSPAATGAEVRPDNQPDDTPSAVTIPPVPETLDVGTLEPGSYVFDYLGTSGALMTTAPWFVPVAQDSVVILEDPAAPESSDARAVLLLRPTGFLTDADIRTGYSNITGPTNDIDAWIDLVHFNVEDRTSTEVAGRPSEVITGTPSRTDTFLRTNAPLPFNGTPDGDYIYTRLNLRYRIWLIDQGEFDPIVAIAIAEPDDEEWFATAQGALDSLTLDPPSEHPNPPALVTQDECIEAGAEISGTVLLEAYGGTRLVAEMPVDVISSKIFPRTEIYEVGTFAVGFFVLGPLDESPDFADAASARDHALGERPTLSEPVLEGFGSEAVGAIVETGDASGPATALRTFSLDGGTDQATISTGDAFWFFDTDQGVFLVTAFADSNGALDASLAMANSIVPTMELVEGLCD